MLDEVKRFYETKKSRIPGGLMQIGGQLVPSGYQRLQGRPQPRRGCPPLMLPRPCSAV
jgi:hypothetical protein